MPALLGDKLVIAISSRALFDLDESHQVYEREGLEAYRQYQIAREDSPLEPGEAFALVQKLLHINSLLAGDSRVEVVLLSRNSADTGLRVFNSIQHYQLGITPPGSRSVVARSRPFSPHLTESRPSLGRSNALFAPPCSRPAARQPMSA